jgi:hypothetical protein
MFLRFTASIIRQYAPLRCRSTTRLRVAILQKAIIFKLNIVKKDAEAVLDANAVAGLEANAAKTKFFLYRHQTTGQDQNLAESKYVGTTVTNQNYSEE